MTTQPLRCAIYTRVSSDAGLEQDFNSLDAQRESAEAYIKSQAHEGWRLMRERFDDGGFSGGSMERPALQSLMQRIQERRIDIVLVYKVDRLTRSLADFAKLVELFDAHKVSFVSVTQSFNTTSSMGRLTLNVLLSFAQFEREVTGERIRDKIAASKRKGLWMGGNVPHGYRVEDRKLIIIEKEAAEVRLIFERYLSLASLRTLQTELRERGIKTRARLLSNGRIMGGIAFTTGPLAYLLSNPLYTGMITHQGQSYRGEHQAIIESDLFEQVQQQLAHQRQSRHSRPMRSIALLRAKLFNASGEKMSPSSTTKSGLHYRYYISTSAMQSQNCDPSSLHRVNAQAIEQILFDALRQYDSGLNTSLNEYPPLQRSQSIAAQSTREASIHSSAEAMGAAKSLIDQYLDRAILHEDKIEIHLLNTEDDQGPHPPLVIPWQRISQRRHREIHLPHENINGARPLDPIEQKRLIIAMAKAQHWLNELINGDIANIDVLAKREARSKRSITMTLSLAFLDPALIRCAIEGRLPRGYGITKLSDLPVRFEDQWIALGLTRPGVRSLV
jgi:DNA invertase Pin-like site-specific DNA recombinase